MRVSSLLPAFLPVVVNAGRGSVSTGGYEVHQSFSSETFDLSAVGSIARRLVGAFNGEVALNLPTGDLFKRPSACLIIAVDGLNEDDDVVLKENSILLDIPKDLTFKEKLNDMLLSNGVQIDKILEAEFPGSVLVQNNEPQLPPSAEAAFKGELASFNSIKISKSVAQDSSPDIILLSISTAARFGNSDSVLKMINTAIPEIIRGFNTTYKGKLAYQLVLLGESASVSSRRELLISPVVLVFVPFGKEQYLLMSWVTVVAIFLLYAIFCCIPWADDLDPLLYASLARDDLKKE